MRRQHLAPQLRLSASALFRSVGTTPGSAHAPSYTPRQGMAPGAGKGTANLPGTGAARHESPAQKILPLAGQCPHSSLIFLLLFSFFPGSAPPLQSSRDRTQSSNSGTHTGQASFCAALWVELLILLIN